MGQTLQGKVAVVTGSGRNIGRAVALLMAQEGAAVVTNNRSPDSPHGSAEGTAREIVAAGGRATPVYADIATMEGARRLVQAAVDAYGSVDILVSNAAASERAPIDEMTEEQWDGTLDACLKSQFACARYAAPIMKAKGWGRIINVSSRIGLFGFSGMASYAAAKAGTVGLTLALAHELGKHGITVNCLVPTATTHRSAEFARFAAAQAVFRHAPSANRLPEHIAPIVAYLCGDAAGKVNGQILYAAGGEVTLYTSPRPVRTIYKPGGWSLEELSSLFPTAFGDELPPPVNPGNRD